MLVHKRAIHFVELGIEALLPTSLDHSSSDVFIMSRWVFVLDCDFDIICVSVDLVLHIISAVLVVNH